MSQRHRNTALAKIEELTATITELEHQRTREIARSRYHEATWTHIGAALGVTPQSAHRRYRRAIYDPKTGISWTEPPLPIT